MILKEFWRCSLFWLGVVGIGCCTASAASAVDVQADTWVATDALGRSLSTPTRPPRADRFVAMFYFMVHGTQATRSTATAPYDRADRVLDNDAILARLDGHLGPDNPAYLAAYARPGNYWWSEPAVGYFMSDDEWVHRKNLVMLADAGVDVVFLDATNAVLYEDAQRALFRAAEGLRRAGVAVPKIGYVLYSHQADTAQRVYDRFYADGRYRDLWFNWLGKPLLMADADALTFKGHQPIAANVRDFFTWRPSWAWTPRKQRPAKWFADGHDKWPWIDDYPQGFGWHDDRSTPEEVPVAIAGHPVDDLGRSFRGTWRDGGTGEPAVDARQLSPDTGRGPYFAQQWRRAIDLDPRIVFVTGWNEWYATRFPQPPPYVHPVGKEHLPYFFVDEYNPEFSRDAMPMRGGFQDNYYLQLVEGVRRFKGSRPSPTASELRTIDPAGTLAQWATVGPDYLHGAGDTAGRDWPGWGANHYRVPAKRNNITLAKVACDAGSVAFYARTAEPVSSPDGHPWMQLLVDVDQDPATGWHGYDIAINRSQPSAGACSVERWTGSAWTAAGTASLKVAGHELMIVVPRAVLGLPAGRGSAIDFHWLDDVPLTTDPADFWYAGESAPDGRFNYRYANGADGSPKPPTTRPTPFTGDDAGRGVTPATRP